ncbi:Supt16h [Symbiodinium sp. CCMP2592]|nr:Supt16h [Symbiodinium sp. CCMP2592]
MEEQRQEELKQRLNQLFKDFAQKVERIQDFPLKFEVAEEGPFQFQGVPSKTNMRLFCCRQSIVGIEEWPPLVVDIRDVEIVCFERALGHTREFDLVLVMKNYNESIIRITMIDGRHLPPIKAWLADLDMVWYTIGMNMNWTNVLKHITEDIEEFLENGGWQAWFTNPNEDSSDDAGKDDGDDDYEPQDSDDDFDADAGDIEEDSSAEDDVEEDEDEDDMDEDAGDEDEDYDGADDDEDSGLDWDELEKEALEEEQRAKKRSRAPAGRGAAKAPPRKTRR